MTPAFASERQRLRSHRCRYAAQSILAVGDFTSRSQLAANALAFVVSIVMLVALPDIRNVLDPPPPPVVVGTVFTIAVLLVGQPRHEASGGIRRPVRIRVLVNRRAEVALSIQTPVDPRVRRFD